MLDSLIFLDKELTLFVNSFFNDFFDIFFYLYTSTIIWVPLYVVMAWVIFKQQNIQGIVTLFFVALVVLCADQISSGLLKPLVERFRPSHDPVMKYLVHLVNDKHGGLYGFTSSHAANTFAVATFFALVVRNRFLSFSLLTWAAANAYSRIYVGVHYIGDVICGTLIGIIVAAIIYQLYLRSVLRFFVISHHNKRTLKSGLSSMFGKTSPYVLATTFWIIVAVLFIVAKLMLKYHGTTY